MNPDNHSKLEPASILVIDDEKVICDGCKMALTAQGHLVDFSLTGTSGIDKVENGSYDLLLVDIKLPDMDGLDILTHVRKANPGTKIIVMTGFATAQNAVGAMKAGAFDYLCKPFTEDELILSIEKAIENKRLTDENLALREQLFAKFNFSNIVGENPELIKIFKKIRTLCNYSRENQSPSVVLRKFTVCFQACSGAPPLW